ncbi:hypothetical protein ACFLYI_01640 [Chloroflexota bacterium]
MDRLFELEITLDYNLSTPYNDILHRGDWVRGFGVSFTVTITNKAERVFRGTVIKVSLEEHLSSPGSGQFFTWPVFSVPKLEPEDYFTSVEYEHIPQHEGVCEILLDSEVFKRKDIIITGSIQKTSVPNRRSSSFSVIRWQELEIIQLLRKLVAKEK